MSVKRWGDYEVYFDRVLGRGGMGAVYMGRQVSVDRPVAVKVLKKELTENPDFVKRFHREAALLARLVDSHVVQVYGAGEGDGQHFYAMEYVEGEDLSARLRAGAKFTPDEVLQIALGVGRALQAAWRQRIVHRDIKPSNIFITRHRLVKVMDFGLAKNPDTDLTESEIIMGTAKYMSPEQATGSPADVRSDLYSLGVVLYELSTGRPPFLGESPTAVIYQQVHKTPLAPRAINAAIPEALEALILRLMAKDPDRRYQTPEDLVGAARAALDGVSSEEKETLYAETVKVEASPGPSKPKTQRAAAPPPPPPAPSSVPLYLSLAAVLGILGTGGYYFLQALQAPAPIEPEANRPPDPPVRPAEPVSAGPPPPEPPPVPEAEQQRRLGLEAMREGKWAVARTHLEKARDLGADVEAKLGEVQAWEELAKGEAAADPEVALAHYEKAARHLPEETKARRLSALKKIAEACEKAQDWVRARERWSKAVELAGEDKELQDRRAFCANFAEAEAALAQRKWKVAVALYDLLAPDPRGFTEQIERGRKAALDGLARAEAEETGRAKKDLEHLLDRARAAFRRAAWKEAKDLFETARDARFNGVGREEIERSVRELETALAAPAGMAYVVAGKFRMGGGREVESPAHPAETRAFYIDVREVTAGEYAEFVKALGPAGHHAGCPKDEPAGHSHAVEGLEAARPDESVVSVTWWDAASYAAWRGKRLPTEAEWEKAAAFDLSTASVRMYPWGDEFRPAGGKSYFGCEGMANGVLEWTADWLRPYPGSAAAEADFGEKKKVLRGGIRLAEDAREMARATYRHWYSPGYSSRRTGFRCAKDVVAK